MSVHYNANGNTKINIKEICHIYSFNIYLNTTFTFGPREIVDKIHKRAFKINSKDKTKLSRTLLFSIFLTSSIFKVNKISLLWKHS